MANFVPTTIHRHRSAMIHPRRHRAVYLTLLLLVHLLTLCPRAAARVGWLPEGGGSRADIRCTAAGPTAAIAADELRSSWRGTEGVTLTLSPDTTLGREGYIIIPGDTAATTTAPSHGAGARGHAATGSRHTTTTPGRTASGSTAPCAGAGPWPSIPLRTRPSTTTPRPVPSGCSCGSTASPGTTA